MKVLYLSDNFPPEKYGGAASMAFDMAKAVSKKGHDVVFVTTTDDKKDEGIVEYRGIKVFKIYSRYNEKWRAYLSLYNPKVVKRVEDIFRSEKPDVVHAHNVHYHLSYYSLKLARKYAKKVFLTAHDVMTVNYGKAYPVNPNVGPTDNIVYDTSSLNKIRNYKWRYNPFRNLAIRHYLGYVDKIFAVSEALKRVLGQNGIDNIEVIHNGISLSEWTTSQKGIDELKKEYNLENKKIILFSGRISNAKGGIKLLEAFKIVADKIPDAILLILGKKDKYVNSLLDMENRIISTGWVEGETLHNLYALSSVVAVPSLCFDSFPNINLEAMASCKPIIGTCFGGTPEAVINGETGYIVNPNDVASLADKISKILDNTDLARKMGQAGRKRLEKEFTIDKQIDSILEGYRR
ncbi:glycosyltransferase family 4 protein [Candidatus Parcubacteria bacterium]|nr:glycosyltransferase family 4 protein [Candidatus Parcubacteria bacterium]